MTTRNRQRCMLPPDGAAVPASTILRISSAGTGSSFSRHIDRTGRAMPPAYHAPCKCGVVKALTGGAAAQRSTCTNAVAELGPWLSRDVPQSRVSTLALPCAQGASSASLAGSYQAPQNSRTTPGHIVSLMTAPAKHAPRALKRRTTSPSAMPRSRASTGLITRVSRPAVLPRALTGPASIWLCNLSRG